MNTQTPMTVSNFLDELENILGPLPCGMASIVEKVKEQQSTISTIAADLGSRLSEIEELKKQSFLAEAGGEAIDTRAIEELFEMFDEEVPSDEIPDKVREILVENEAFHKGIGLDCIKAVQEFDKIMGAGDALREEIEKLKKENKRLTDDIKLQKTTHKKSTDHFIKLMSVMTPVIERQGLDVEIEELTGQIATLKSYISKMQGGS